MKVVDEITVDISTLAWTVNYRDAEPNIVWEEIQGVQVPFLSLEDLVKSKQTYREKDKWDLRMLAQVAGGPLPNSKSGCLGLLRRLLGGE